MLTRKEKLLVLLEEAAEFLFTPHHFIWKYLEEKFSADTLRSALSRLKREGFIERSKKEEKALYRVSKKGLELLETLSLYLPQEEKEWDGYWRIVSFDFPEEEKRARTHFRRRLRALGFGKMHRSVWISPHNLLEKVAEIVSQKGYDNFVWMFEGKLPTCRRDKKEGEELSYLVKQAWPQLPQVEEQYKAFIKSWVKRLEKFLKENKSKQKAIKGILKKLAHLELGKISRFDPQLPSDFLSVDWPRDKALHLLRVIEREL